MSTHRPAFLLWLLFLALVGRPLSAEDGKLSPTLLAKLKAAATFIRTAEGSGSGFVIKSLPDTAWVVTNAHVVRSVWQRGGIIQVIFNSGQAGERQINSQLIGYDPIRDLALLMVPGQKLGPALEVSKTLATETMSTWVVGFPFGDMLSLEGAGPAPTITPARITSIRTIPGSKQPFTIQLDGGINPGNSGGPVVDARGQIIGISVAKMRQSDIGFAIPAYELEDLQQGRVGYGDAQVTERTATSVTLSITLGLIDPVTNIKKLWVMVGPIASLPATPVKCDAFGRPTGPVAPGMVTAEATIANGVGRATVTIKGAAVATPLMFQVKYQRKNGNPIFTEAVPVDPPSADPTVPATPIAQAPGARPAAGAVDTAAPLVPFTWTPPVAVLAKPASSALLLAPTLGTDGTGESIPVIKVSARRIFDPAITHMAAAPDGSAIYAIRSDDAAVIMIDPVTWQTTAEIPVPQSPKAIWADQDLIAVACWESRLICLIDAHRRTLLKTVKLDNQPGYQPDTICGRAPDGSLVTLWQCDDGDISHRLMALVDPLTAPRILITDSNLSWATWLPPGKICLAQGTRGYTPSSPVRFLGSVNPEDGLKLHNSKLLDGGGFHRDTGRCFLLRDRSAVVMPIASNDDHPMTVLVAPSFDRLIAQYPGAAICEIPELNRLVTLDLVAMHSTTGQSWQQLILRYIRLADGLIERQINLDCPDQPMSYAGQLLLRQAAYLPGHEILLLPISANHNEKNGSLGPYQAFICGPVATSGASTPKPTRAKPGQALTFTPDPGPAAKGMRFAMKRPLEGMAIDPTTGTWSWTPTAAQAGAWKVTILGAVDGKDQVVAEWTIKVE